MCERDDFKHCGPHLGHTMGWVAHMARASMDARVSKYDITPVQTRVLLYLHQNGGQAPQCELVDFLRVKPSTANGILDRMEEKGLVRRSVSGKDARRRLIDLTEKGLEQQERMQEHYLETERLMVRGLTQEEQETLIRLLDRVIENLKEDQGL